MTGAREAFVSRAAAALALIAWVIAAVWAIVVVALHIGVLTVLALVTFPAGIIGGGGTSCRQGAHDDGLV